MLGAGHFTFDPTGYLIGQKADVQNDVRHAEAYHWWRRTVHFERVYLLNAYCVIVLEHTSLDITLRLGRLGRQRPFLTCLPDVP